MVEHPGDGALHDWQEIAEEGWDTLLVGNGLSINLSPDFAYASLYEKADKSSDKSSLDDLDRDVFERFGTTNFEVVLGKLRDAIATAEVLGEETAPYRERFRSVQVALGTAVRSVHLERAEIADSSLQAIKEELSNYRAIFSTSYDLILYWAIGYEEQYAYFCDCFWNEKKVFDPADSTVRRGNTPIYYMHGALHLIVEGSGVTRKLTRNNRTLLDQFGEPIEDDPEARPLLISEGSARDKLLAVEGNDYLAHVYETFKERPRPLVVFGHALGAQDGHLIEAINASPDRPVAISMVDKGKKALRKRQAEVLSKLDSEDIYFFDAATHPFGSPDLTAVKPRVRFKPWANATGSVFGRSSQTR